MQLEQLVINGVRNITCVQLDCGYSTNIITGKIAAGKTAILESIYLLSRATSFRTPRLNDVVQHGKQGFSVSTRLQINGTENQAGIEKNRSGTQIRFNGSRVRRRSEQALNIPVIAYTAETSKLLYDIPRERRHWLDWSMFHVEPDYMDVWRTYHHALRQRNTLLRANIVNEDQYQPWEKVMAETAFWLNLARNEYLAKINDEVNKNTRQLLGESTIRMSGIHGEKGVLRKQLEQQRTNDRRAGHTREGPHRHDVCFQLNGYPAGKTLSRGEGKQFLLFLLIAQARVLVHTRKQYPIVLIDDLPAELDRGTCSRVFNLLARQPGQIFVTAIDEDQLTPETGTTKRFHVEHGKLAKLVK